MEPRSAFPDGTIEILQALPPTAHERAQHARGVLVEGGADMAGTVRMICR